MNVVVCAPMNLKGDADGIPRWRWPVIFFAVEGVSFVYWAILRLMDTRRFEDIMKFRLHIYTAENNPDAAEKEESRIDGSRRRVHVEVSSSLQSCFAWYMKLTARSIVKRRTGSSSTRPEGLERNCRNIFGRGSAVV